MIGSAGWRSDVANIALGSPLARQRRRCRVGGAIAAWLQLSVSANRAPDWAADVR